jgi:isochorismate hydrolase
MRDLKVVFPEDANATFQDEVHKGMIISLDMGGAMIVSTDDLVKRLKRA